MQTIESIVARISALAFIGLSCFVLATAFAAVAEAQAVNASASESLPIATIVIEPVSSSMADAGHVKMKVAITNNTDWLLGKEYIRGVSALEFDIRDQDGKPVPETDYGCKRHSCGGGVTVRSHATALAVKPRETLEVEYDIGAEYKLKPQHRYSVTAVGKDFVLVHAPPTVAGAPARFWAIMNYRAYSYQKLGALQSNTIPVQAGPALQ